MDAAPADRERVTIVGDDAPPVLSVTNTSTLEGTGGVSALTFTLTLSAPSALPVSVTYATVDHTATAPADYAATSGVATFAPGVTTAAVVVPVVADAIPEPSESLLL